MRQLTRSSFVQIMACRLFGAKPLSMSALAQCKLNFGKNCTEISFKIKFSYEQID